MTLVLAGFLCLLLLAQAIERSRRRVAINRCLHELRRPLQTMALSGPQGSLEMAFSALADLDRVVNGTHIEPETAPLRGRDLVEQAAQRARPQATARGAEVRVRWMGGSACVFGDRIALASALDNLLANAIDHGGSRITVAASVRNGRLRVAVMDSGAVSRRSKATTPAAHHGHGLRIVRSVVSDHGGRFALQHSGRGSVAMLELPLAPG